MQKPKILFSKKKKKKECYKWNTILKYNNNKHGDNGIEHMVIKIKMI